MRTATGSAFGAGRTTGAGPGSFTATGSGCGDGAAARGTGGAESVGTLTGLPGAGGAIMATAGRFAKGSTGGPHAVARAKARSFIVAVASDDQGMPLATVRLQGANPYDFTGAVLAWGAAAVAAGRLRATGALGPVDAFGLDALEAGVAEAGIARRL
ncbi:MAG: hypothetical protein KY433_08910 [Actinobacteria bacterium]|nr:hypothetical protein [Actinomycetota bacterium]